MKLETILGNEIPNKASPPYSRKCNFMNKFSGKATISKVIPGISATPGKTITYKTILDYFQQF